MDINKWLEGAIAPERPTFPEELGLPSFLLPKESVAEPSSKHRHRRKPSPSDSSFIEAEGQHRSSRVTKRQTSSRYQSNGDTSTQSSSRSRLLDSEEQAVADRYNRRSRRKTRPDRYEPKPDKPKDRERRRHGKEREASKKTRRRSKRKTKDKSGASLVQGFRATNVSKERLTLKPGSSVGLFNKGRASSPVRGRGLPDLVFSEMQFLQKRKNAPPGQPDVEPPKKLRKKDRARANEEEISAYFNPKRPALVERDVNTVTKSALPGRQGSAVSKHDGEGQKSTTSESMRPTVERPAKPYLGFGSRGTRPQSTSYFSWSESVRQPSHTPGFRHATTSINVGGLARMQTRHDGDPEDVRNKRSVPSPRVHEAHNPAAARNLNPSKECSPQSKNQNKTSEADLKRHGPQKSRGSTSATSRISGRQAYVPFTHSKDIRSTNENVSAPRAHHATRTEKNCMDGGLLGHEQNQHHFRNYSDQPNSSNKENSVPRASSPLVKLLKNCEAAVSGVRPWQTSRHYEAHERPGLPTHQVEKRSDVTGTEKASLGHQEGSFQQLGDQPQRKTHSEMFTGNRWQDDAAPLAYSYHEAINEDDFGLEAAENIGDVYEEDHLSNIDRAELGLSGYGGFRVGDETFEEAQRVAVDLGHGADAGQSTSDGIDEVFAGFWRPHKLY